MLFRDKDGSSVPLREHFYPHYLGTYFICSRRGECERLRMNERAIGSDKSSHLGKDILPILAAIKLIIKTSTQKNI